MARPDRRPDSEALVCRGRCRRGSRSRARNRGRSRSAHISCHCEQSTTATATHAAAHYDSRPSAAAAPQNPDSRPALQSKSRPEPGPREADAVEERTQVRRLRADGAAPEELSRALQYQPRAARAVAPDARHRRNHHRVHRPAGHRESAPALSSKTAPPESTTTTILECGQRRHNREAVQQHFRQVRFVFAHEPGTRLGGRSPHSDQRGRQAHRDVRGHVGALPEHTSRQHGEAAAVLRRAVRRVLLRSESLVYRRHPVLLPEQRGHQTPAQCGLRGVPRGAQVLRVGPRGAREVPGRRGHCGPEDGAPDAEICVAAADLAAVRVPGELMGRADRCGHFARSDHRVDLHVLHRDAAGVQALPVQREHEDVSGRGERPHRRVLLGRDHLHRVVHVRVPHALRHVPRKVRLLQVLHEHLRPSRHSAVRHSALDHRGPVGRREGQLARQQPGHDPHRPARRAPLPSVPNLQADAALEGPPDPRTGHEGERTRTRTFGLLSRHRRHNIFCCCLLRRVRRPANNVLLHSRRLLVYKMRILFIYQKPLVYFRKYLF